MALTRKDLREAVYRRLLKEYPPQKVPRHLVHLALEEILDLIIEALCRGETVLIKGFGRFEVRKRSFHGKGKNYLAFKSSPMLKDL